MGDILVLVTAIDLFVVVTTPDNPQHQASYGQQSRIPCLGLPCRSKILKLGDQYKFEATLFMHNYAMGKLPVSFANMCTFNYESQANVQTRQSNLIRLPRCNSSFASKLPKYNFPNLWNNWVLKD